jgi:hypothetical protein
MSYGTDADALNYLSKASSDLRGSGTPISVKEGKEIIKLNHAMSNLPQPEKKLTTEQLNNQKFLKSVLGHLVARIR